MRIVRTPRTKRFTMLPNELLEDTSLSFKARGLLAYLLSRPDGWHTDATELASCGPDGRTAMLSGLRELEEAGYLHRKQFRDAQGQFFTECWVQDTPGVRFPDSGESDSRQPDSVSKNGTKELEDPPLPPTGEGGDEEPLDALFTADFEQGFVETVAPSKPRDDDPGFLAFWSVYPRHIAKQNARKAWRTAIRGGAVPGEIIAGAEHYRDDYKRKSKGIEFTAHPATWLNGQRWLDWAEEENAAKYRYSNNPFEN